MQQNQSSHNTAVHPVDRYASPDDEANHVIRSYEDYLGFRSSITPREYNDNIRRKSLGIPYKRGYEALSWKDQHRFVRDIMNQALQDRREKQRPWNDLRAGKVNLNPTNRVIPSQITNPMLNKRASWESAAQWAQENMQR